MPKKKRKSSIRYDRIAIVALLLFLLIFAIVKIVSGNDKKDDTIENIPEEFVPVIYLSPSNQDENLYATGDATEAEVMRRIGNSAKKYLESNNVIVHIAETDATIQDKVDFSNSNEITAHVAIHSNAKSDGSDKTGTECLYNPKVFGSRMLAEYIYNRVSRLTPSEDRGMFDGTEGSSYLFEVAMTETPNCLIEIDFHDTHKQAKWIIDNTDEIGKSIADGIMQYIVYIEEVENEFNKESSENNDSKD